MTFAAARDMIEIQKLFKRPDYYEDMLNLFLDALKEKYDTASSAQDVIFYGYLYQEKKRFALNYNNEQIRCNTENSHTRKSIRVWLYSFYI